MRTPSSSPPRRLVLAVTGASGMPYAQRLVTALSGTQGLEMHLILSDAGRKVYHLEMDRTPERLSDAAYKTYSEDQIAAPPASGSWQHDGMIVCPCSMSSLAAIAGGLGNNLVHRAADVTLKERRKLVLVVRETPYNRIHLANMLAADQAGAVILPASPGFYHKPLTVADLVDQVVARILDHVGVPHDLAVRWGEEESKTISI